MKYFFNLIFLLTITIAAQSQPLSESQIQELALKVNQEINGLSLGNGIVAVGCFALGRTLIYQYNVPDTWSPPDNLKDEMIANLKTAGVASSYYKNDINTDFLYYNGNTLINKISIKSSEFSIYNFELGEYISVKDHPKAKGVNLKLKPPIGWEIKEGDRPNIVKKFVYESNTFLILIRDNATFYSRKEAKELLLNNENVQQLMAENTSIYNNYNILNHRITTIDTYPALEYTVKGSMKRSGVTLMMILKCWVVIYEDKIVFLQAGSFDSTVFNALENVYSMIANSVIFPEQYN